MAKILAFLLGIAAAAGASGQHYPARDIHVLCNFAAGTGADLVVRLYSAKLAKLAGRPVIVINKGGTAGVSTLAASTEVAKASPDGHTILITPASSTIAAARYFFRDVPFDPVKDFAPVTTMAKMPFVVMVNASTPIKDLGHLAGHLKGKQDGGAYGARSAPALIAAEIFKIKAGVQTKYLRSQNRTPLAALTQGVFDFAVYDAAFASTLPADLVRIVAVTSVKRTSALPDIPSWTEQCVDLEDVSAWWGVLAPAGTPKLVTEKLAHWINEITLQADTRAFWRKAWFEPFPGSPDDMHELLRTEAARWNAYAWLANLRPE